MLKGIFLPKTHSLLVRSLPLFVKRTISFGKWLEKEKERVRNGFPIPMDPPTNGWIVGYWNISWTANKIGFVRRHRTILQIFLILKLYAVVNKINFSGPPTFIPIVFIFKIIKVEAWLTIFNYHLINLIDSRINLFFFCSLCKRDDNLKTNKRLNGSNWKVKQKMFTIRCTLWRILVR